LHNPVQYSEYLSSHSFSHNNQKTKPILHLVVTHIIYCHQISKYNFLQVYFNGAKRTCNYHPIFRVIWNVLIL